LVPSLVGTVGGVVETGFEAVEILLAVAGERTRLARDDTDRDLRGSAAPRSPFHRRRPGAGRQARTVVATTATKLTWSNFFVTRMCVPFTVGRKT
jgi:hypothetical protein